ncbi:MAG: hypothetical protein JO368_05145, partial [Acidimicrobiales bacterium]|nr:hypothetical protein [Acidimicrobiales bacterium]
MRGWGLSRNRVGCIGAVLVAVTTATTGLVGFGTSAGATAPASGPVGAAKSTGPLHFPATGYFRTAQADGRWWLVTPTGEPFYADGVDHVSASGDVDKVTGTCPYCQTIANDYPSTAAWGTAALARLRSWGFNNLGAFSDNNTLGTQMPFTIQLSMGRNSPDWFSPDFVTAANQDAASEIPQYVDNPNLIGYFTDAELPWGPPGAGPDGETALQAYLNLPAGSPGQTEAQKYQGNPNGFVYDLAVRYFSVTTAAVHAYDTNHLILGVKAEGQEIQPELLEAAKGYVDVFSVEDYTLYPGFAQIIDQIWPQYLPVQPNLAN